VFEEHLPERVRLPEHTVRRGTRVVRRDSDDDEPREVVKVTKGNATVRNTDGETGVVPVADLVVVADFGEPISRARTITSSKRSSSRTPARSTASTSTRPITPGPRDHR